MHTNRDTRINRNINWKLQQQQQRQWWRWRRRRQHRHMKAHNTHTHTRAYKDWIHVKRLNILWARFTTKCSMLIDFWDEFSFFSKTRPFSLARSLRLLPFALNSVNCTLRHFMLWHLSFVWKILIESLTVLFISKLRPLFNCGIRREVDGRYCHFSGPTTCHQNKQNSSICTINSKSAHRPKIQWLRKGCKNEMKTETERERLNSKHSHTNITNRSIKFALLTFWYYNIFSRISLALSLFLPSASVAQRSNENPIRGWDGAGERANERKRHGARISNGKCQNGLL